jgi:alpha-1,3-rhamnosyltransferase
MTPVVTVVVPSYNHARFVAATLRSILQQSFRELELLVVDDGSQDDSVSAIRAFVDEAHDPRIDFRAQANRGLCRTLNEGLERARGKYFCYVGSDDLWEPDRLAEQVDAIESAGANVGAAFSDCWVIDADGNRRDRLGRQYPYRGGDIYDDLVRMRFHPPSPTNLFVRDKLILAGGFNEALPIEDRDTWLRLARLHRVAYVDRPLASFRVHQSNTSTSHPERMNACNQGTFSTAFRVDPALAPFRRPIRARLAAGEAAQCYQNGELSRASEHALRSLTLFPLESIAWRVLAGSAVLASPLGPRLQQAWRARRRSV